MGGSPVVGLMLRTLLPSFVLLLFLFGAFECLLGHFVRMETGVNKLLVHRSLFRLDYGVEVANALRSQIAAVSELTFQFFLLLLLVACLKRNFSLRLTITLSIGRLSLFRVHVNNIIEVCVTVHIKPLFA